MKQITLSDQNIFFSHVIKFIDFIILIKRRFYFFVVILVLCKYYKNSLLIFLCTMLKAPTLENFLCGHLAAQRHCSIKTHLPIIIFFFSIFENLLEVLYQLWQMVLMGNYKNSAEKI